MSPLLAAAVAALGPATTLGMARFAYALVLPAMKTDLALTYAQSGWLNGANAVGYLLGALPAARVIDRFGARATLVGGMLVTAAVIAGSGLTRDYALISMLRLVAGVTGALAFVAGGSLASQFAALAGHRQALTIGVYMGGVGFGILLSGLLVPALLAYAQPVAGLAPWQLVWVGMGALSAALTAFVARRSPPGHGQPAPGARLRTRWPVADFAPALIAYLLYGLAYIGYMTFIVAYVRDQGFGVAAVSAFWSLLGLAATLCTLVWARPIETMRGGRALAAALAVLLVGTALPLASSHPAVSMLSAALFGLSFTAAPAAVIAIHRRGLAEEHVPSAIGLMTAAFAAGQIVGPVVSGGLADALGGLAWGLAFSTAALAVAVGTALAQKEREGASAGARTGQA